MESEELKKEAREAGANLVGVASVDRFKGAPKGQNHLTPFQTLKAS